MKRILISLSICIGIFGISWNSSVKACSCMEPAPVMEAVSQSDAVFLGTVKEIRDESFRRRVTVLVSESWKGVETNTVMLYTGFNDGDCGLPVTVGSRYLFYANVNENLLTSTICSRTTKDVHAEDDLQKLGEGNKNLVQLNPGSFTETTKHRRVWMTLLIAVISIVILIVVFRRKRKSQR